MDAQRIRSLLGAIVTAGFGTVLWLIRHEAANPARHIEAHDSVICKVGAYLFWALAFWMLLGAVGVISQGTMNGLAHFFPLRRRRVVTHHHHHYHPSAPPAAAPPPASPPSANGDPPTISKWTD